MPFNMNDPTTQGFLKMFLGKQYGGWSNDAESMYNSMTSGQSEGSGLSDYSGIQDLLKKRSETGMENLGTYRQNAQTAVNTGYNKSALGLKESLAQSGLLRSGVGASAQMGLDASRMGALGGVEEGLMRENESYKTNALQQLMGLNLNIDSQTLQKMGLDQNALLALMGYGQTTDTAALQDQRESSGGLGGLLGGIGGMFLGGLGGSLGSSLGKKWF